MVIKEVREKLPKDALVFDNYSYDSAIIGVTLDGRAIYCYEEMVIELMQEAQMDYEEACEWIDYNTIRSLAYAGEKAPIIVWMLEE